MPLNVAKLLPDQFLYVSLTDQAMHMGHPFIRRSQDMNFKFRFISESYSFGTTQAKDITMKKCK